MKLHTVQTKSGETLHYIGPHIDEGPMPTLFYFALSGEDSLMRDPFNQPVQFLEGSGMRIFSITLPGHEDNLPPEDAMKVWAKDVEVLPKFIERVRGAIEELSPHFLGGKIAVAGLSRGAFIACHVAAVTERVSHILGYAPLTRLSCVKEFQGMSVERFDLEHLIPKLKDHTLRFYIGNLDVRVGTEHAFSFVHRLAQAATTRTPPIEMIISPSIGFQGHGTGPDTFRSGVDYLKERFLK